MVSTLEISKSFDFLHLKSFKPLDPLATASLTDSNFFFILRYLNDA